MPDESEETDSTNVVHNAGTGHVSLQRRLWEHLQTLLNPDTAIRRPQNLPQPDTDIK